MSISFEEKAVEHPSASWIIIGPVEGEFNLQRRIFTSAAVHFTQTEVNLVRGWMILNEFLQSLGAELSRLIRDTISLNGTSDGLRRQVRIMFGRGELSREEFFRLLALVNQGQYIEGELKTLQRRTRQRMEPAARALAAQGDRQTGLETVYISRARIEEVRAGYALSLKALDNEREWLERQAADFWSRAQKKLPDEPAARADLEIRQQMLARQVVVEQRQRALQLDFRRLEWLEMELYKAEGELLLVQSGENLLREEIAFQRRLGLK